MMKDTEKKIDLKLCECGCGEEITSFDKNVKPKGFKRYHNAAIFLPKERDGEKNPMWKGGVKVSHGYIFDKAPDHPDRDVDGYVRRHRLVMEQHIGRRLESWEDVHHINGDKKDNRIENLELLDHKDHVRLHALGNKNILGKFKDMTGRVCKLCGSDKTGVNIHNGRPHWLKLDDGFMCHKCHMKEYHKKRKSQSNNTESAL